MALSIKKAKKDDFDSVWNLLKQLFIKDNLSKNKTKKSYLNLLKDNNAVGLVLKQNNQIIGYASIKFMEDIQIQNKIGYMSVLIIEKSFRGKGYGTKFLKGISKIVKKKRCKELQFPSTFKRKKSHNK